MKKLVASKFKRWNCALFLCCLVVLLGIEARADRSLRQQDPAYMYEKVGEYAKAAVYWHRAMRGVSEVWIPVMWGDVSNAPGKWRQEYRDLVPEYRARVEKCLRLGEVSQDQLAHIEFINEIWMDELITQEDGGFRISSGLRAVEAEKYGDFVLAEVLRRSQVRLFRLAAIPYHERAASRCEKQGRYSEAQLHRQAIRTYQRKAAEAEMLANGDKALARIPGLGGKSPGTGIDLGHVTSIAIRDAFNHRVVNYRGEPQTKMTFQQVVAVLKEKGLKHKDENARLSAATVLGNLGEKEALLSALDDSSSTVRLAAAKLFATIRGAEGWAACANHRDAAVRGLVTSLLKPAGRDVLLRTYAITRNGTSEARTF